MKMVVFIMFMVLQWNAFAGDNGGGKIKCQSDSGRTVVEGGAGVPYNGTGPADLTYTIDGQSLRFSTRILAAGGHVVDYVVFEHKKLYAVGFKRTSVHNEYVISEDVFQLRSVSGTMKQVQNDVFTFKAIIPAYTSLDPRLGGNIGKAEQRFDKDIQVNCELDVRL